MNLFKILEKHNFSIKPNGIKYLHKEVVLKLEAPLYINRLKFNAEVSYAFDLISITYHWWNFPGFSLYSADQRVLEIRMSIEDFERHAGQRG